MLEFHHLVSVNFQGIVIVFGRPVTPGSTDIYFNVLDQDVNVDDDARGWSGFVRLDFPDQVRQVGMSLVTLDQGDGTIAPAAKPFRALTDQKHVILIQQSAAGTLYVNRFRLLKTQSGSDGRQTSYSLAPVWEVRFARSGNEDVPADKSDKQDYLDPDGFPFLEPSLELPMIDGVADGAFDVALLPISGKDSFAWQFLALDLPKNQIRLFNFPADGAGLFDLGRKTIGADFRIAPDSCFSLSDAETGTPLTFAGAPRATTYVKHEKIVQPDGSSIGVRRATRVMLALPVNGAAGKVMATVDSAVGTNGTMAKLSGMVPASTIVPAEFDLRFNGFARLDLVPPAGQPDPLALTGAFAIRLLIAPGAGGDALPILGGDPAAPPESAAPYIRIVDGDKIEVGFGTGAAAVACRTLQQVLFKDVWCDLQVNYAGPGDNPFAISVNGCDVHVTACTAAANPAGTPITQIGAASGGFQGALKLVRISAAGTTVLELECNAVDYDVEPPTTPDKSGSGVIAEVHGAILQPSTSPIDSPMSGAFSIDAAGLTSYTGLAPFIAPASDSCLIEGGDGMLHLYYRGQTDDLTVAQCSTEASRATFAAGWTTNWRPARRDRGAKSRQMVRFHGHDCESWSHVGVRLLQAPDAVQAGSLTFVAHRVGTYMNPTEITVDSSAASPLLCDVTVHAPGTVGTETWTGLPRDITLFERIWNGAALSNPDDPEVQSRAQPYFDYSGKRPAVIVPAGPATDGAYFLLTSVPRYPVSLAAVEVAAGSTDDFVTIAIDIAAPGNWAKTEAVRQVWPDVPRDPQSIIDTLAGTNGKYDYGKVTTPGSRAYGLRLGRTLSDDQASFATLFVQNRRTSFSVTISDGSTPTLCKVEICGALLVDVPRDQAGFAQVLNGEAPEFPYPPGYKTDLASQIFVLGNGLSAGIVNHAGEAIAGGSLAYAGLVRVLYQGAGFEQALIATQARTLARSFQKASFSFEGEDRIARGSLLFGALIETAPSNGGIGRLVNAPASLQTPGVNGGWSPVPPSFCLGMTRGKQANRVDFDVTKGFIPAERLAILSDLTLEAWLSQDEASATPVERALTYQVEGNLDHPTLPIRLMMGALQGPALNLSAATFLSRSFNFLPPALTVQIYLRLPQSIVAGTILTVSEVNGATEYLSLSLDQLGKVTLGFLSGAGRLQTSAGLPSGKWVCLTAVVADAGSGTVRLALAVNDQKPITATAPNGFTGKLGTLTLGTRSRNGIVASANGVAFWQRALDDDEVANSYLHGFADSDPMLGIRWNLAEGSGTLAVNSAATGAEFDATVTNPAPTPWDAKGAFNIPYAGRNDLVLASNRILKGWTQIALVSRQGRGLALDGKNSGRISDGSSFNPSNSFALEAWIAPQVENGPQTILEKPGSYSLYVNTAGQVCLKVELQQEPAEPEDPPILLSYDIKAPITMGETSHVAVNFMTGTVKDNSGSDQFVQQRYFVRASITVNGDKPVEKKDDSFLTSVQVRSRASALLLGIAEAGNFLFRGMISHLRVWSRNLTRPEILQTYSMRATPDEATGLIAGWDFEEEQGTQAVDLSGNYTLDLTSNQLWSIWQDVAQAELLVNGRSSTPRRLTPKDAGDYGDRQFTFGAALSGGSATLGFHGKIDDLRLFDRRLTGQQVRESMNSPLTGGEEDLAGYWKIDAGSGGIVYDQTGQGNNGRLVPASGPSPWLTSSAPLQNEAQHVLNALGGRRDYYVARIDDAPSVIDYASAEKDAYGQIFSVLKRGYFYRATTGRTELQVGYKVGDLDTIFVGQVQSKPTIIGYVEGGPPLPSENLTLAFWQGDEGGPARLYAGISTVTYLATETRNWSFNAAASSTFNGVLNAKGGFYQNSATDTSAGLGLEAGTRIVKTEISFGPKLTIGGDLGSTDALSQSHANTMSLSTTLSPAGTWEPEDDILNMAVGRRYIPNNIGMALVKSATADLFMLALKGTQTPVGYIMAPNDSIPVDSNIINFPINPGYIKNGTLDGKIGLMNDPSYPNADGERGSYFKPVEAYALKRRIEKQEQSLKAYYDQFDVNKFRLLASFENVRSKLADSPGFDFTGNRNLRSLVNNYVWTAAGGLHREEHSVANSYAETYTGASSLKFALGLEFKAKVGTPAGGFFVEADTMLGNTWTMTATKAEARQNGFSLASNVLPTGFLPAPILDYNDAGHLEFKGYGKDPAPGKVDAYRFMSFLIAPEEDNFTQLAKVVDQNWLTNSATAAAGAMREAMANPASPWRVLHRTTYVSRVPAPFQAVKDDTTAPNIVKPANLPSNRWLTVVLARMIGTKDPTRLQIGAAIDLLLSGSENEKPVLDALVPWWAEFLTAARIYGSEAFRELATLRADMLTYMAAKYEADAYASQLPPET